MDTSERETSSDQRRYGQRAYINHGEEDEMEVVGYRTVKWKLAFVWIAILFTLFILKLIFYWRKDWEVKCIGRRCSVAEADWVILEDRYKQLFAHRVRTQVVAAKQRGRSVDLSINDAKDTQSNLNSLLVRRQVFFRHQKLKYLFSDIQKIYEKISIPPLRCSYFLQTKGLTGAEQENRRWIFGENAIRVHVTPVLVILVTQALNPFYIFQLFSILLWTAGESYYYYSGCIGFLTIVSLAAQVLQQRMMERALKKTIHYNRNCIVWRADQNAWVEVPSESLVPGDLIQIPDVSDAVMPCDVVLTSGNCIMNESMLTGESVPVTKVAIEESGENDTFFDLKEHSRHILFSGTNVIQLRRTEEQVVKGVVYRTAFSTAKGELVRSILFPKPMDFKFTKDSYKYVGFLAMLALVGMIYTIIVKILNGDDTEDIIIRALDLVTIVVPPALPAAMTFGIVFAQIRLRRSRIFCISPNTINVCGSLDVFCFDKTGTLTEDGLDLLAIRQVTNARFDPVVNAVGDGHHSDHAKQQQHPLLREELIETMATCHSLAVINGEIRGDPLDLKLFQFTNYELEEPSSVGPLGASTVVRPKTSSNGHASSNALPNAASSLSSSSMSETGILKQFTFSSKLQRMSVITRRRWMSPSGSASGVASDQFAVFAKGSPEMIASLCKKVSVPRDFDEILINYTSQGFRVIAIATKTLHDAVPLGDIDDVLTRIRQMTREEVEIDLTFLGLLVMENRLKPETTPVIRQLRSAKIRVVMVTGDNMLTALSVARDCKLVDKKKRVILVSVSPVTNSVSSSSDSSAASWELNWCPVTVAQHEKVSNGTNADPEANVDFEDDDDDSDNGDDPGYVFAMTGKSWGLLRQHFPEFVKRVAVRGAVFARFSPDQKKQLIEELQSIGYYVGMCGDGANDCGALKTAHSGISLSDAEASVASPFTSKDPNIECVPSLIREGRASLVTSFGIFKYMAGYSMTQFLIVCIITWPVVGTTLSDFQFLYEDLVLMTTLGFTFCFTGPSKSLHDKVPMIGLIAMAPITSLICTMSLNLGVMIFSYYYTQAQPWYESPDERDRDDDATFNYDQTVLFLITCSHFITMAVVFAKGRPHRGSIFTNYVFLANVLFCTTVTTIMIFNRWDWWANLLLLKMPPSTPFQAMIVGVSCIHFFASYLVEIYFVDGFVERWIQPCLFRVAFGESLEHRRLEAELRSTPDWPPKSAKSFDEVMEMELVTTSSTSSAPLQSPGVAQTAENGPSVERPRKSNGFINEAFDPVEDSDVTMTVYNEPEETVNPEQHLLDDTADDIDNGDDNRDDNALTPF